MMVFAYALYVPAGIALTSAFASQLLADTLQVTIAGWLLFVVILGAVVVVAYLGIRISSSVDLVLAIAEVAVIAALAITILVRIGPEHYSAAVSLPESSPNGQLTDITNATIYGVTAFAGYEAVAALGEEANNPRRSVPASATGIVIATGIFYLLVVFSEVSGVGRRGMPSFALQSNPLGFLASQYWSPSTIWAVELVVVLTGLGFVIASLNAAIRVLFAMGREQALPASLARPHLPVSGRTVRAVGCPRLSRREYLHHPRIPRRVPRRVPALAASARTGNGHCAVHVPSVGDPSSARSQTGGPAALRRARMALPRRHRRGRPSDPTAGNL